jgi:hypothetical protein
MVHGLCPGVSAHGPDSPKMLYTSTFGNHPDEALERRLIGIIGLEGSHKLEIHRLNHVFLRVVGEGPKLPFHNYSYETVQPAIKFVPGHLRATQALFDQFGVLIPLGCSTPHAACFALWQLQGQIVARAAVMLA